MADNWPRLERQTVEEQLKRFGSTHAGKGAQH